MLKKYWKMMLLFLIVTILTLLYSCFFTWISGDVFWNYGFSYNISKGLVIYRDFNVMLTPLFFFIGSMFIRVFGSYIFSLLVFYAILTGILIVILFKLIKWKAFIIYPMCLYIAIPGYNYLALVILFIIIYLIYKIKDNDILIGVLVSLIFLTKQSLGLLFIPCLIYSKNKLKTIISFGIPIFILFIYLIYYDAFYQFIDYCFFGLLDFNDSNKWITPFLYAEIIIVCYLLYKLFKSNFKDKELFYILLFQIVFYPMTDFYHFVIVFIPCLYSFLKSIKNKYLIIILLFTTWFYLFVFRSNTKPFINLKDNYLYLINDNGGIFSSQLVDESIIYMQYIADYNYSFYIMDMAYAEKLYINQKINKYDLLNTGNMGYHGIKRYINEINDICKDSSCVFFVKDAEFEKVQFSEEIYNYVIDNYERIGSNKYFDIYSNKVM